MVTGYQEKSRNSFALCGTSAIRITRAIVSRPCGTSKGTAADAAGRRLGRIDLRDAATQSAHSPAAVGRSTGRSAARFGWIWRHPPNSRLEFVDAADHFGLDRLPAVIPMRRMHSKNGVENGESAFVSTTRRCAKNGGIWSDLIICPPVARAGGHARDTPSRKINAR
jgi:hypothetical protein